MKTSYSDKLKDPRWQRKRLEILLRDDWACQICFNRDLMLVCHHRYYLKDVEPWDYPNDALVTLCQDCHESEHVETADGKQALLNALSHKGLFSEGFWNLALTFDESPGKFDSNADDFETFLFQIKKLLDAHQDEEKWQSLREEFLSWKNLWKKKNGES